MRKAYANRLRSLDQDADPDSFIRLRSAYEAALSFCRKRQTNREAEVSRLFVRLNDAHGADRSVTQEEPGSTSLPVVVNQALQEKDIGAALDLYEKASAAGEIPLGASDPALDAIMDVVAADLSLPSTEFKAIMKRVGWLSPATRRSIYSRARFIALQRLEAEEWYSELQRIAAGERSQGSRSSSFRSAIADRLRARAERRNARLLLRDRWQPRRIARNSIQDLKGKLAQFRLYERWVGQRFDPKSIERAKDVLDRSDELTPHQRRVISMIIQLSFYGAAIYFGLMLIVWGAIILVVFIGGAIKLVTYLRQFLPPFISDVRNRASRLLARMRP